MIRTDFLWALRWGVGFLLFVSAGCAPVSTNKTMPTSLRPVEKELSHPQLEAPLISDFLAACDAVARDMVLAAVFQTATRSVVVEIEPVENATGSPIDCKIYPETIRSKIIESGFTKIAFRDETARPKIISERMNQSDRNIVYRQETEISETGRKRVGPSDHGKPLSESTSEERTSLTNVGEVSGKTAIIDYFLKGKIYAQNETSVGVQQEGYRYYQFQFRLTDARTAVIVWEKIYRVKRKGGIKPAR